ncbi:amidohydrolase family protein [Paenibacillus contaminans]|uniref:Amidohydrolase n=1 Tax=Paenibacillus contaminans TaxID=450362 RepID=A0A329MLD4_9BACL|nr:amidohydrolase family protein [Paenibacillus contaminans]RAV20116.1 amidohydrolase [Paenibacillus contaminans]
MAAPMKVIDCDVHNMLRSSADLVPYLKEPWKSMIASFGVHMPGTYSSPIGVMRKDAVPPGGGIAASDPDYLVEQLVKPYNMEYAILTGGLYAVNVHPDPDYAAAVASAYNDYLIAEWLPRHPSFKGAMIVPVQDPQQAVREIDRIGPHPDIVEIMLASASPIPYGNRFYHPIYEAAERHGLPIGIHPGSEGGGISAPPTAAGYPTNYLQWHTSLSQNFMAHLISLVCEGVFEKFPRLRFVLVEGGVAWLPHLMWRLDKNYKALRWTVPWLKKMPSEYIRENCFLTTQPIEEPEDFEQLKQIFDMIDAERMLLFSSDYPHWDFDDPTHILRRLPEESRRRIFYQNAKELYNL